MTDSIKIAGVPLTHPDKPLYPDGTTKLDIARYYERVADKMMPFLKDRPVSLVRAPHGVSDISFYQRHPSENFPDYIDRVKIREKEGSGIYISLDALEDLIYLVNLTVLEFHVWGCKASMQDKPDMMVFDLDPGEGARWKDVVNGAFELREMLKAEGRESWVKTSGKKGLHMMVDIKPEKSWEEIKEFTKGIAQRLVEKYPNSYTINLPKVKRKGKVFVDYLRNTKSASNVCAYSTRIWEKPSISMPLDWDDLNEKIKPDGFDINFKE